jgi:MFS family permease
MYDWSGIYFRKAVHTSGKGATLGFVVYMVAMTLGRLTGDKLANRFGIKNMLTYSGLLIGSGLLLAVLLPFPLTAGLGFMLTGFGVSCVIPMVFSMAGRSVGMSSGSAIAAVSTVGYFGFLLVPPLVGSVAELAGLRWSFGLIALFGIAITVLVQRILTGKETPDRSPRDTTAAISDI